MRNGGVFERHKNHLVAGQFATATDRIGHFTGFTETNTDAPLFVAHNDERTEIKAASTFHDLRRTVDENHLLDQLLTGTAKRVIAVARGPATSARAAA